MKTNTLKTILMAIALFMPFVAGAQTYEIYKNNGDTLVLQYNEVDSIVFRAKEVKPDPNAGYVDLGLSVKWATCNVGATVPTEYGDYFAWGEIEPKDEYTQVNSLTYMKEVGEDIFGNPKYDAATAILGAEWRMPTYDEMDELCTMCTWDWTTIDGCQGYQITGPNGNTIFLPAAGRYVDDVLNYTNFSGLYWLGDYVDKECSYCLLFDLEFHTAYCSDYRFHGLSIRPVRVE